MNDTSFDDAKQLVERGYDKVAHAYARLEGETEWPRMRWLGKVLRELERASSVLDLGCGSGDPADVEIARAHQVTGVDISQAQINLARQNVPAGDFIHGDAAANARVARRRKDPNFQKTPASLGNISARTSNPNSGSCFNRRTLTPVTSVPGQRCSRRAVCSENSPLRWQHTLALTTRTATTPGSRRTCDT